MINPRQLEIKRKEVKLTFKILGLILVGTATQILQESTKAAQRNIYHEFFEAEYDINTIKEEVLSEDQVAFFEYIERDFNELVEGFANCEEFTAHLYKVFFIQF